MSEENKKTNISIAGFGASLFLISLFVLFLNWVQPAFVPAWIVTIAFWYVIFNIVILVCIGVFLLVLMVLASL